MTFTQGQRGGGRCNQEKWRERVREEGERDGTHSATKSNVPSPSLTPPGHDLTWQARRCHLEFVQFEILINELAATSCFCCCFGCALRLLLPPLRLSSICLFLTLPSPITPAVFFGGGVSRSGWECGLTPQQMISVALGHPISQTACVSCECSTCMCVSLCPCSQNPNERIAEAAGQRSGQSVSPELHTLSTIIPLLLDIFCLRLRQAVAVTLLYYLVIKATSIFCVWNDIQRSIQGTSYQSLVEST